MRTLEAYYLTSNEVKDYLKNNDAVILPVGAFEMHGEHGPLGCDAIIDDAFSKLLAEKTGSLVLPPIYYTYTGATIPFPGTVWVTLENTAAYLKNVVKSLLDNGFRRIIVSGSHGPHSITIPFVLRSLFEERPACMVHCRAGSHLTNDDYKEVWGNDNFWLGENSLLLGAAKYLGKQALIDPSTWKTQETTGVPHPVLKNLRRANLHVPYHFSELNQHLAPLSGLDYDRGFKLLERDVDRTVPVLKDLSVWADHVEKQWAEEQRRVNY